MPAISFRWGLFIVLALIGVPIFAHLDELPVQLWDEARLVNGATEMLGSHNWFVVTFNGAPDLWSTKPPLQIWLLALCMKLFGLNELGVRMPSSLAAAGTCLYLFWFLARKQKNVLLGILAALVLVCSKGFMALHCARTGDYDALLTFCITAYCIHFFLYLEEGKRKHLWLFSLFAALAFLTKGVAGGFLFPGLFIYALCTKKLLPLLKTPAVYMSVICSLLPLIGYYLLREHINPGYLQAIRDNELGGRFGQALENHKGGPWFYYNSLLLQHYSFWFLFVPCGISLGFLSKTEQLKKVIIFAVACAFSFLLIISGAATKIVWYEMPLYPFLAIITAVFIYHVCIAIATVDVSSFLRRNPLPLIFVFLLAITPYRAAINDSLDPETTMAPTPDQDMCFYLQNFVHDPGRDRKLSVYYDGYFPNIRFYLYALEVRHSGVNFIDQKQYQEGTEVAVFQEEARRYIADHFESQETDHARLVYVYKLIHRYTDAELKARAQNNNH